jgi:uncharacterized membrane protein
VYTFVVTLHVLSAVLIIGPFGLSAFSGYQAVKRYDADDTRDAARWMARFGAGSVLIALLGAAAVPASDKITMRTPWVIISLTLYVIMMGLATGYTVPALRRAARILEEGVVTRPESTPAVTAPDDGEGEGEKVPPPAISTTATEMVAKERLDSIAARIAGSGGLVLLAVIVITVLMVTKPFGN